MFSKALELTGLSLIVWGFAVAVGTAAALFAAGLGLLFIGGVTDDAAVGIAGRRAAAWVSFYWHRRALRRRLADENARRDGSPHPPIEIDPEMERLSAQLAAERRRRGDGRITEAMPDYSDVYGG